MTTAIERFKSDLEVQLNASHVVEVVIKAVARRYRINTHQVTGRAFQFTEPRHLAIVLCVEHSGATHAQIAQRFSGRAAGAVGHSLRQHLARQATDFDYRARVAEVEQAVEEDLR